jgi:uncharacterized protein (DUF433 family)
MTTTRLASFALTVLLAACGGGGGGSTDGGGNPPPGPQSCSLDTACGSGRICEGGTCVAVLDDHTDPQVVSWGPNDFHGVPVGAPLWFTFSEPMRIAPGGFRLYDAANARWIEATAELSTDRKTLTLHPIGVVAPVEASLSITHVTDLSGNLPSPSGVTVRYTAWWPLTYALTSPQSTYASSIDVAVDGDGGVLAAWHAQTAARPGVDQVLAKRWNGAAWDDLGVASADETLAARYPQLAAAGSTAAIAFTQSTLQGDRVVVRTWTAAGGWSEPLGGSVDAAPNGGTRALAVDGGGLPVLAYTREGNTGEGKQLVVTRWDGAGWSPVGTGSLNADAAHDARALGIGVDADGALVVAFREVLGPSSHAIYVKRWTGTQWTLEGGAAALTVPAFAEVAFALAGGQADIGWLDDASALQVRRVDAGVWTADERVTPLGRVVNRIRLLAEPRGALWAGWGEDVYCEAAQRSGGAWVSAGRTNDTWGTSFWCGGGAMAVGSGVGPVVLFQNVASGATNDEIGVFAVNR